MVKEEVGADDIADVISAWTGIPAGRLMEGESEKLLHMEQHIGARLVGQADAVRAVSDAVRRTRAGVSDPDRPTGSFLFLGPTGVGKTELAKSLADFLFDDERAMVRIDMSEYSERHSVARLIGAPPGYVGYEEGGQLTEAVRRRPYSVILLDEVEKAHPETFDILLQVLDDGRLTDGQGRTVDFRNVILVLTSNLGSQYLTDPTLSPEARRESVMGVVRSAFKPEFLNRLDEVVVFDALSRDDLAHIVDLQVRAFAERLSDRRITLEVTDEARQWLAARGYDPAYGARPLRRLVQREIGDRLARGLLSGEVRDGSTVAVGVDPDGETLVLSDRPSAATAQRVKSSASQPNSRAAATLSSRSSVNQTSCTGHHAPEVGLDRAVGGGIRQRVRLGHAEVGAVEQAVEEPGDPEQLHLLRHVVGAVGEDVGAVAARAQGLEALDGLVDDRAAVLAPAAPCARAPAPARGRPPRARRRWRHTTRRSCAGR